MSVEVSAPPLARPGGQGRNSAVAPVLEVARNPILRVIVRRLLMAIPLLFVVSGLSFLLVSLTPGDAAREILGLNAPPGAYPKLRAALGLNLPLYTQYWHWVEHAVQGNFGTSLFTDQSVSSAISQRLPVTFSLMIGALVISTVVGVALGVFSAVRGGAVGRAVDGFSLVGFALPSFWVGAGLIAVFAVKLGWFPAIGYVSLGQSVSEWFKSLVLPWVALSLGGIAAISKQTREAMLEVLASEHVRMGWANGLSARSIFFKHALKNASLRVVTMIGLHAVGLLGGTVLVENVFALPGLGSLIVNASIQHDLPIVEGVAVYFTVLVVAINLLTDIAYSWLNPRVRAQ